MLGLKTATADRQVEHFDAIADGYDTTIPEHVMAHLTRRRVALARSLTPAGDVLDVGCGTGRFLRALPPVYGRFGVDPSAEMLTRARAAGIPVEQAGGDALPFPDGTFDLVTTFAVLHHLIDPELVRATLLEMARVAKPGGALIVWDHNPLNPYWRVLMARLPQDTGDEQLVPASLILDTLEGAGVDVELTRMTFTPDFTPRWALRWVTRAEVALERTPGFRALAAHNVVVARKPPR